MRFVYEYRTSDNVRHEGTLSAADREAAFSALRSQGIRPGRLVEAPGIMNKVLGKGKRWIAIGCLFSFAVALLLALWMNNRRIEQIEDAQSGPLPRHQLYGDPALISDIERNDFATVFPTDAERILAWFAQPGVMHTFTDNGWAKKLADGLAEVATVETPLLESDPREIVELKRIMMGMKGEVRRYLSNGIGTPERYVQRLLERQVREMKIYQRAVEDLKNEHDPHKREQVNAALRAIGLRTVPRPDAELEWK